MTNEDALYLITPCSSFTENVKDKSYLTTQENHSDSQIRSDLVGILLNFM